MPLPRIYIEFRVAPSLRPNGVEIATTSRNARQFQPQRWLNAERTPFYARDVIPDGYPRPRSSPHESASRPCPAKTWRASDPLEYKIVGRNPRKDRAMSQTILSRIQIDHRAEAMVILSLVVLLAYHPLAD